MKAVSVSGPIIKRTRPLTLDCLAQLPYTLLKSFREKQTNTKIDNLVSLHTVQDHYGFTNVSRIFPLIQPMTNQNNLENTRFRLFIVKH